MTKEFTPSPQQQAFFDWIDNGSGSCILEAVAGAGKTETLVRGMARMGGSVLAIMFNKSASVEFKSRAEDRGAAGPGKRISTVHGVGLGAWMRAYKSARVDENKVRNIIDQYALSEQDVPWVELAPFITKMVSLCKQLLANVKFNLSNDGTLDKIVDHYGLDYDLNDSYSMDIVYDMVRRVFRESHVLCPEIIDFDDMIYAPLAYNLRLFRNDWVVGDEWQDTNPARREFAIRSLKPGGRFVGCGDSRQAIYGFTGADHDALELSAKAFNASYLPLTVTYRCPKAVVSYVHQWVSHIEAHPAAPEGVVRPAKVDTSPDNPQPWFKLDTPTANDAVLCRYTKPLVSQAFAFLRAGIPCRVEGRDIGNNLIQLATRWKVRTLDALTTRLDIFLEREIRKARKARSQAREQAAIDKVDTLHIFIVRCREKGHSEIGCLVTEIRDLFKDDVTGVTVFSTIHKAKGREWPNVYWMQCKPRGRELKAHEKLQEDNLCYVAGTRAKEALILVPEAG